MLLDCCRYANGCLTVLLPAAFNIAIWF
ncbi:MAG: hypothetical protein DRQ61_03750 [Gammaproteobacteria bacterium]|nr:MAG: hypothetical protein DRQ61_03750 [Gammaproteobacteria bacterium]